MSIHIKPKEWRTQEKDFITPQISGWNKTYIEEIKPKAEPCILINRLSEMEKSLMTASVEKFEQPRKWKISSQSKHFLFGFALGALSLFAVLVWLVSFYN